MVHKNENLFWGQCYMTKIIEKKNIRPMHSSNKLLLFCPIKNSNSEQYCTKSYANLFVFKKSKKNTTFYHINMAIDIVIFHN